MAFTKETIIEDTIALGFDHAGLCDVSTLKTLAAVRDMCAADKCQIYNKYWTCPPGCGTIEECEARMKQYDWGVLAQCTAELEDSMDYEAMMEGMERQKESCAKMVDELNKVYASVLPLTNAGCDICKECTYPDAPCRFPKKATSPMEGYGLLVSDVCKENGIDYYYGANTVTYTSLFLIKEND